MFSNPIFYNRLTDETITFADENLNLGRIDKAILLLDQFVENTITSVPEAIVISVRGKISRKYFHISNLYLDESKKSKENSLKCCL